MDLKDKTIVITGAGKGIGLSCVEAFLDAGAYVYGIDIEESSSEALKYNPCYFFIQGDISSEESIRKAADIISRNSRPFQLGELPGSKC